MNHIRLVGSGMMRRSYMTSHGINGNSESVTLQELVVGLYAGNDNTNIDDI